MNPRIELILFLVVIAVGVIFIIKSKWFDRQIDNLLRGPRAKDVSDLKADAERLNEDKRTITQEINAQADAAKAARQDLKSL